MELSNLQHGTAGSVDSNMAKPLKIYSRKEVALHDTPEDCWLLIDGKVYDVTEWVPKHPGGTLIHARAGQDSTYLFHSYHPLYVWKLLEKYCIGEIEANDETMKMATVEYKDSVREPFYLALKERVEAHFRKNKINPRVHPVMFLKTAVILALYGFFYYLTFFQVQTPIISYVYAIVFGYLSAHLALNIMHDGNHGSYSSWPVFSYIMGIASDVIGASSYIWRQQHIMHHTYTNVNRFDPDIRANDIDLKRVHSDQPINFLHAYQHIYLWPLYGLLAIKAIWFDDFIALLTGTIEKTKIMRMTRLEKIVFWGTKALYLLYMVIIPLTYTSYSTSKLVKLYLLAEYVNGMTLALLFEVSHVVDLASFFTIDVSKAVPTIPYGWATVQVIASTNYSIGSTLWLHLTGGLNYQIEHHLFPGVCHMYYPTIQPIVKETCKDFNLPYKVHDSFFAGLISHYRHLKKIGRQSLDLKLAG